MSDIFISYAREDADVAHRLSYLYALEDWSCWWDPQLPLGTDFRPFVTAEITTARAVVVLWSAASRSSRWVAWEVGQARKHGRRIAELAIEDDADAIGRLQDRALIIDRHPHRPPLRDRVLAIVASTGGLLRRCDGWNARIHITSWRGRPPKRPVIAWEWVHPGTERRRLVRRERWTGTPIVTYGTTIGNAWLFGHEGEVLSIGYLFITQAEYRVRLPRPDPAAERRARRSHRGRVSVPFNIEVRFGEILADPTYPGGGVDLANPPPAPGGDPLH